MNIFKKIKIVNKIVNFFDIVEKYIKNNNDKIQELIELAKKIIEILPQAKEQVEGIIEFLKNFKKEQV